MKKQSQGKIAGILLSLFAAQCGASAAYDFDNLIIGHQFPVGSGWVTNPDWVFAMSGFELPDLSSELNGFGEVGTDLNAGGFFKEMGLFSILLEIDSKGNHSSPGVGLSFLYGEYGGSVNFKVNGDFINTADFSDLDGTMLGGAAISVDFNPLTNMGVVIVDGAVETFAIGGQELYIDSIRSASFTSNTPVPAAAWLFVSGFISLIGVAKRKKTE